jgi:sec-independent protein translocase protein TatA
VIGDILQPTHLLFVLVIALLVLGPKRLPEVGRSLGRGLRDFRHAMSGEGPHDEVLTQNTADEPPAATASTAVATVEPESEPVATGEPVGAGKPVEPAH